MPGRRLSNAERSLADFWENPPANFPKPLLRSIAVDGDPGLRGVKRMTVPFLYPLTVVCGRNGVGKSTLLALATLSAKPPDGWSPFWGNTKPRGSQSINYAFRDFFHRTAGSPPMDGMQLTWVSMFRGNEIERTQRYNGRRWVNVADPGRNPNNLELGPREIDFIPISRIMPASELAALRSTFTGNEQAQVVQLTPAAVQQLSFIMGKQYQSAEVRFAKGLVLPKCHSQADYTGFDMGGGEGSVILLLARLQDMPKGGLVIIEEVELALHQEAQVRLMEVLVSYCATRRLQIICTSHSEAVIDAVPRNARVLLSKLEDEHQATSAVSTRFAVHQMLGAVQPELEIITEDAFAAALVGEAIAGDLRPRVRIQDIGSNAVLARQAVANLRTRPDIACLSVFDGDCTEADVNGWIDSERAERALHPSFLILPGNGVAPEKWVLQQLQVDAYRDLLALEIGCSAQIAAGHVAAMTVDLDHHDCGHTLHMRTGISRDEARRLVIKAVARSHPELDLLRARVKEMLGA